MKFRTLGILLCALATFVFAACTTSLAGELSHELPPYASLPSGHDPLKPEELMPHAMPAHANAVEGIIPTNGILTVLERVADAAANKRHSSGTRVDSRLL